MNRLRAFQTRGSNGRMAGSGLTVEKKELSAPPSIHFSQDHLQVCDSLCSQTESVIMEELIAALGSATSPLCTMSLRNCSQTDKQPGVGGGVGGVSRTLLPWTPQRRGRHGSAQRLALAQPLQTELLGSS